MFNKIYGLVLLTLLLLLVSVSGVCAADNTTGTVVFDNNCVDNLNNGTIILDDNLNNNCCGAIAFQSVLKENGINITLEEANKAIHSVNGTTSMQGLIDGAKAYNLTATPIKLNSDFKTGFIVHIEDFDGVQHWANLKDFSNYALIISKDSNLNTLECYKIIGNKKIKEKWQSGFVYIHGKWYMGGYRVPIRR